MDIIEISHEAYIEFKNYLDNSGIGGYNLRIGYVGKDCNGAVFNIEESSELPNDVVVELNDLVFYIDEKLIDEYKGFIIFSNNENNGEGLELKPIKAPPNPCIGCSGC